MHTLGLGDAPLNVLCICVHVAKQDNGLQVASTEHCSHFSDWVRELRSYLRDGSNMLVRSALLQTSFIVVTVAMARLGAATLAAHQIVLQVWLLTSYVVDGFAAAGTVLGSRLSGRKDNDPQCLKCAPLHGLGKSASP
jgi:Na+-driven multidrug efflux pump